MGRKVRMVSPDWRHPAERTSNGAAFKPLLNGSYEQAAAEWDEEKAQWDKGFVRDYATDGWKPKDTETYSFEWWTGERPVETDYMPTFAPGTATHLMMYEDTSGGTPLSPAFAAPEELARWLADNNASAFGNESATYEQWLRVCKGGYAPSMVISGGTISSGVAALTP